MFFGSFPKFNFQNLMLTVVTEVFLRDIPNFAYAGFGNHDFLEDFI